MTAADPAVEFVLALDDYPAGEVIHRRVFAGNAESARQIGEKMHGLKVLDVQTYREWIEQAHVLNQLQAAF